jgi:CTP:molybdopterin cytidylyltransferase MocA
MRDEGVAGILLAAGAATRFGADKLAAELDGRTLLQWSAAAMIGAGLDPVLVVIQPGGALLTPDLVTPVVNDRWRSGIATSVQTGLAALDHEPGVGAAIVAPADQPWCRPGVYRRLVDAFRASGRGVVVAAFDGAIRNPVLLAREQWPMADRIEGDTGLSAVLRAVSPLTVECADIGSLVDIDTPSDLARARRSADVWPGNRGNSDLGEPDNSSTQSELG